MNLRFWSMFLIVMAVAGLARAAEIPVAPLGRKTPVDFESEVLPILRTSCLACHNRTTTKGGLVLETPATMLQGGDDGPVLVPGKSEESSILKLSAHREKPFMPPHDNKAKAPNLTPEQLGLVKLWIDQGARGEVHRASIQWQPIPSSFTPAYAVAVTGDGRFAAAGRANQLHVYDLPFRRMLEPLCDPALPSSMAHRDMVYALAFSPDGQLLASGSYGEVKLWQRQRPTTRLTIGADAAVDVAASSADGKWILLGNRKGGVRLVDAASGKLRRSIEGKGPVRVGRFSPDGKLILCGWDGGVEIWGGELDQRQAQLPIPSPVRAGVWVGDHQIAIGCADGVIRTWTFSKEWTAGAQLKDGGSAISALEAIGGTSQWASGSADGSIRLWEMGKPRPVRQWAHGGAVTALAARPDGKVVASAGENGTIKLWDLAKGTALAEMKGDRELLLEARKRDEEAKIASADVAYGKGVVSRSEADHKAQAERLKKAEVARSAATRPAAEKELARKTAFHARVQADLALARAVLDQKKFAQGLGEVKAAIKALSAAEAALAPAQLALSNANNELELAKAAVSRSQGELTAAGAALLDGQQREKRAQAEAASAKERASVLKPVRALAFSADGMVLASGGDDQKIHTWSGQDGESLDVLDGHAGAVNALAFVKDGELISGGGDPSARVWEIAPRWVLLRRMGTGDINSPIVDRVNSLAFGPDGKVLASGSGEPSRGGQIMLWNVQSGSLLTELSNVHSDAVLSLDFSRDGQRLASGAADRFIKIIDIKSGKVLQTLEGHTSHVLGVSFKADGRTLASGGADGQVKMWDLVSGEKKGNIPTPGGEVTSIHFIGISDQAVLGLGEGAVRIINESGGAVRAFSNPADHIHASAIAGDGSTLLCGGQSGAVYLWDAASGKMVGMLPEIRAAGPATRAVRSR